MTQAEMLAEIKRRTRTARGEMRRTLIALSNAMVEAGYNDVKREVAVAGGTTAPAVDLSSKVVGDTLKKKLRGRALTWAGVVNDDLLTDLRTAVVDGMTTGSGDLASLKGRVESVFRGWVADGSIDPATGERLLSAYKLEAVTRTTAMAAYNEGRIDLILDPDADTVQAVQYSAILDSRTSAFCRGMDGVIVEKTPANEARIREINPPNHVHCRSFLVPVTEYEDWDETPADDYPTTKNKDGATVPMQPQKGFGVLTPAGATT